MSSMRLLLLLAVAGGVIEARSLSDRAEDVRQQLLDVSRSIPRWWHHYVNENERDQKELADYSEDESENNLDYAAADDTDDVDDHDDDEDIEARGISWGSTKIAFMSHLSEDKNHGEGQHIKFDIVTLNDAEAYDRNTGVFTAPTRGVYQFTFVIAQTGTFEMNVNMMVDGEIQVGAVADGARTSHDTQGVNSAIIFLNAHQRVWVEAANFGKVIGDYRYRRHTSFSGHLLYTR